jgi:hypothetical protein
MHYKKIAAIIVVLLAAAGIAFLILQISQKEKQGIAVIEAKGIGIDRNSYGIPSSVFSELPQAPKDFNKVVELYYAGKINGFYLSDSYYKQPEFLRNFQTIGLQQWLNPEKERWNVVGFGILPASQTAVLKNGKAKARVFFYSSFGVRSFQGLRIEAELPEKLKDYLIVGFSEQEFLLEPSFPKFEKEWIKAVGINLQARNGIPKGVYEINFSIARPSLESQESWSEKHPGFYFDAASFSSGKNVFKVFLRIE